MITITCPQCNYSRSVSPGKIPPRIQSVRCPQCGSRFPYRREEEHDRTDERQRTPWERRSQLGLWRSIKQTVAMFVLSPKRSFSTISFIEGGLREPLAFGLLVGSIGAMFSFFWKFIIASSGGFEPWKGLPIPVNSPLVFLSLFFFSPFLIASGLFVSSLIIHLLLLLVRGNRNGFGATFSVIAYSQATRVWSIIPFIGDPIGLVWRVIVQIIGLKQVHQISYAKIFVAFLIPFALLVLIMVAVGFYLVTRL